MSSMLITNDIKITIKIEDNGIIFLLKIKKPNGYLKKQILKKNPLLLVEMVVQATGKHMRKK